MLAWARENVEIRRLSEFDQKVFDEEHLKLNVPVIYTGMGNKLESAKWTLGRLKSLENPIQVRFGLFEKFVFDVSYFEEAKQTWTHIAGVQNTVFTRVQWPSTFPIWLKIIPVRRVVIWQL